MALILIAVYFNVIGAIIGIIVGAVYMGKEGTGYKSYGRMLLIVSIVFLVIDILMFIVLASAVYNFITTIDMTGEEENAKGREKKALA